MSNNYKSSKIKFLFPINIMSFKSGKYKNLTYDQIINNGGETLNNLINSKHVSYKKFNEYYQQKKSIQDFIIKREKKYGKKSIKKFY